MDKIVIVEKSENIFQIFNKGLFKTRKAMKRLAGYLLLSAFSLLTPWVFAQGTDQSSPDSGVLVSSPLRTQALEQDNNMGSDASNLFGQGHSNGSGHHSHRFGDGDSGASSQNITGGGSDGDKTSKASTDEIVVQSTHAVMLQITENMKLTQDQISAIQPIIEDNIAKVRNLQLSLEKGAMDGTTMYRQKERLIHEENQKLSLIFTPDQMKVWINIQNR